MDTLEQTSVNSSAVKSLSWLLMENHHFELVSGRSVLKDCHIHRLVVQWMPIASKAHCIVECKAMIGDWQGKKAPNLLSYLLL